MKLWLKFLLVLDEKDVWQNFDDVVDVDDVGDVDIVSSNFARIKIVLKQTWEFCCQIDISNNFVLSQEEARTKNELALKSLDANPIVLVFRSKQAVLIRVLYSAALLSFYSFLSARDRLDESFIIIID